jgi:hypothetical protein
MFSAEWRVGKADWQSSKQQTPSSRKIPNSKVQNRRGKRVPPPLLVLAASHRLEMLVLVLGIWSFSGAWSLELLASLALPQRVCAACGPRLVRLVLRGQSRSESSLGKSLDVWQHFGQEQNESGIPLRVINRA